jgi:hypothetical protein
MRRARQGAGHCAAAEQVSGEGATVRYIRMTFLPDDETSTKRKSRLTGVVASGLQASDTCRKTEAPHDGLVSLAARDPVPDRRAVGEDDPADLGDPVLGASSPTWIVTPSPSSRPAGRAGVGCGTGRGRRRSGTGRRCRCRRFRATRLICLRHYLN